MPYHDNPMTQPNNPALKELTQEKMEQIAPSILEKLNPDTRSLVDHFAKALAEKLAVAQEKYGFTADWLKNDWRAECIEHFHQHVAKGDPRDVAAYCAFMWHHGWSTTPSPARPEVRAKTLEDFAWLIASQLYIEDLGITPPITVAGEIPRAISIVKNRLYELAETLRGEDFPIHSLDYHDHMQDPRPDEPGLVNDLLAQLSALRTQCEENRSDRDKWMELQSESCSKLSPLESELSQLRAANGELEKDWRTKWDNQNALLCSWQSKADSLTQQLADAKGRLEEAEKGMEQVFVMLEPLLAGTLEDEGEVLKATYGCDVYMVAKEARFIIKRALPQPTQPGEAR